MNGAAMFATTLVTSALIVPSGNKNKAANKSKATDKSKATIMTKATDKSKAIDKVEEVHAAGEEATVMHNSLP